MKFLLSLLSSFILTFLIGLQLVSGLESQLEAGEQVFSGNCAGCHANGNNVVVPEKNLKMGALEFNGKDSVSAIITQVTMGNGGMPAFDGRLSSDEIENVANYVFNQATNNSW